MNTPAAPRYLIDTLTGKTFLARPRTGGIIPQQAAPLTTTQPEEAFTIEDLGKALRHITPSLLILGIATGAAFAIGSGLVTRFLFHPAGGRR